MTNATLNLWFAYPADFEAPEAEQAAAALFSDEDRARWQRLRFDRQRRELLATRFLVRSALSQYRTVAPDAWRFSANTHGKPAIEPECGLRFNLTNSPALVACAIMEGSEVGVDVEPWGRAAQIMKLGDKIFSPGEMAAMAALDERARSDRALTLWTLKEACVKARGVGLGKALEQTSFLIDRARGIRLDAEDADDWRFRVLDHAEHRVALAVQRAVALELEAWELKPATAAPVRLTLAEWHT